MWEYSLLKIFNFFRLRDEDEVLVAGYAGTEEFFGMYEAVEILKRDGERMEKRKWKKEKKALNRVKNKFGFSFIVIRFSIFI